MNALLASIAIERESGLETIPHVTPRDTSVMGLQSILLGAHADGIRNVLAVTGDPPEVGDYAGARGVYEVDSIGLTQILGRLNDGTDFNGREIDAPTSFFPGVAVNPTADDLDAELERFARKIEAGAKFAMTQALFDLRFLERMLERLGGTQPDPAARRRLLRAQPPARAAAAQRGAGNRRARAVQAQLRDAGTDAAAVGLALARELVAGARDLAAGVYVIPPFRQPRRGARGAPSSCRSRPSRCAWPSARTTEQRRMPNPAREPTRAAKIVDSTCPCALTAGPPELPWRTRPLSDGHLAQVPRRARRRSRRSGPAARRTARSPG